MDGNGWSLAAFLASDAALMLLSMGFGLLLGLLWSGRIFSRRVVRPVRRQPGVQARDR